MQGNKIRKLLLLAFTFTLSMNTHAEIKNPCANMFNLINRPSVADSACVVAFGHGLAEMGYQYQTLRDSGHQQNLPELQLRLGLPFNNEINVFLPDHIRQTDKPHSGSTAAVIGLKHEYGYTDKWLFSIEALITQADGSDAFGSKHAGTTINAIYDYNMTDALTFTAVLGVSSLTQAGANGGQRFSSINPDVLLSWDINDNWDIYLEAYGVSHTDYHQGPGYNCDGGVIYLLRKNITLDASVGQRIKGNLGGFKNYVGIGFAVEV